MQVEAYYPPYKHARKKSNANNIFSRIRNKVMDLRSMFAQPAVVMAVAA